MILKNTKQKAFTIVELLIVIVVIGILAAISIVAYNGIQNRSRNISIENAASQVFNKVESYKSIVGEYPTASQVANGLDHSGAPSETHLEPHVEVMTIDGSPASAHSSNSVNSVGVSTCGSTGFRVEYFQSGGDNGVHRLGSGCS